MNKKRVLQIDSHTGIGGAQTILESLVEGLSHTFEITVLPPIGAVKREASVFSIVNPRFWRNVFRIRSLYKSKRFDIVHAHGTRAAAWARLAAIGVHHPPIIYTLHGFHIARSPGVLRIFFLMGEWFLNHWVKYLVCVSEADEKFVKKLRIIDRKKIILIRNGIDIARFRVERGDIVGEKGRMGLRDMCVVTTIARLNPPKDFNTLLYGFASAVKGYENLQFFIVGNGPLRGEIEDRVNKLGLQNKVRLLGFREDIPRIIAVSDVIVLSSKWEGLSLVTLEAGAGEKPVIASNAEGIRETVIDGVTGCLFPVGDSKKLAEHIKELAVSRDKREKMGKAGLEFVEKNFKKEDMLGQYKKLYEAIY